MNLQPHKPRPRPTQLLSALMLWLSAVMSVAAGIQQVAPLQLNVSRHAAGDARSGDLPTQRSTAPNLQSRQALLLERVLATPSSGFDGHDAVLVADLRLGHPTGRAAEAGATLVRLVLAPLPSGFRARAPPILA